MIAPGPTRVPDQPTMAKARTGTAREPMSRGVQVRPGVRDEIDPSDLESRPGGIPGGGRFMREERGDRRRRDARVGRHSVDDLVAEVHDAAGGISSHGLSLHC